METYYFVIYEGFELSAGFRLLSLRVNYWSHSHSAIASWTALQDVSLDILEFGGSGVPSVLHEVFKRLERLYPQRGPFQAVQVSRPIEPI